MWDELYQVLLGLVGAGIGLAAVYAFMAHAQRQAEDSETESSAPSHHEDESTEDTMAERHEALPGDDGTLSRPVADPPREDAAPMAVKLFISAQAGAPMQRVEAIEALAGRGLKGDRYCLGAGHWTELDECEVTLIAQEDLDEISSSTGLQIQDGQHRRNIVTRNIHLASLMGRRFRIGAAYFAFPRARPPCLYLQSITEPGMARALVGRGGIGVHCFKGGTIRENDSVVILKVPSFSALVRRLTSRFGVGF